MRCPFCQQEMGAAQQACPACGRPHSPYVAYCLQQAWLALQRMETQEAERVFAEALRYTPANDRAALQQYRAYLLQQAQAARAAAAMSPGPQTPAQPAAGTLAPAAATAIPPDQQPTRPAAVPAPSQARSPAGSRWVGPIVLLLALLFCMLITVTIRSARLLPAIIILGGAIVTASIIRAAGPAKSTAASGRRALFLHFNEQPLSVVRVMDDARRQQQDYARSRRNRVWLLVLLFPAGLLFILLDLALGYNMQTFTLVGLVLWAAAIIGLALLGRDKPTGQEFGPFYEATRQIFQTIKDDLAPGRTLVGWLDLTGPQASKIVRQSTSASGIPINIYRDEWLRFKAGLYDGNMLRVSALERIKSRLGHWKRSLRGKRKWKAGRNLSRHEVRIALTINPTAYEIHPQPVAPGSKFQVQVLPGEGRVEVVATTGTPIDARDILWLLRVAYSQLAPRAAASTGG